MKILHNSNLKVKSILIEFRSKSACFMRGCETVFELIGHESCVTSGTNSDMKKMHA